MSYTIDPQQGLVRTRAWATCTSADLRGLYHRLIADPRFRPDFLHLTNLEAVTEFAVDACAIVETASWPVFDAGTRRAIVAPSDIAFGLSRMFSLCAERVGQNVRVFRDAVEAMEWLNAPLEPGREPDLVAAARAARLRAA
jgi:hypothetical protein